MDAVERVACLLLISRDKESKVIEGVEVDPALAGALIKVVHALPEHLATEMVSLEMKDLVDVGCRVLIRMCDKRK